MNATKVIFGMLSLAVMTASAQSASPQPPAIKVSTVLVTRAFATNGISPAIPESRAPGNTSPKPVGLGLMNTAALQTALDRYGFGVGLIDGQAGARTSIALRDYARASGQTEIEARDELLADPDPATVSYTVTPENLKSVGSAPADWEEAATLPAMACGSIEEVLSEQFHVSRLFLQRLNPALTNWAALAAGTSITVPNVRPADWSIPAARLEVDCSLYRVRAFDTNNDLIASFPCSIAKKLHKVPVGDLTFTAFAPNPNYTFDPENFPESARAQDIAKKLIIPPGPRNPVGVYWLSLSAPGFGMHGTPHPETIGRRESHGCFRLTNWDITTLAGMLDVGTPVRVMGVPREE